VDSHARSARNHRHGCNLRAIRQWDDVPAADVTGPCAGAGVVRPRR